MKLAARGFQAFAWAFLAILVVSVGLNGCATTPEGELAERIAVKGATVAVIKNSARPAEKAARVLEITKAARVLVGDDVVTANALRLALVERIQARNLPPEEVMLAMELIDAAMRAVDTEIHDGFLSPAALVSVNNVLTWVESVAVLYVSNTVEG